MTQAAKQRACFSKLVETDPQIKTQVKILFHLCTNSRFPWLCFCDTQFKTWGLSYCHIVLIASTLQTFVFVDNSKTWLESHEALESKAGVESNGGLCKETAVIPSVYLNIKSALMLPAKKQSFVLQNNKRVRAAFGFWNGRHSSLPLLCKSLKTNLGKTNTSLLTISKFKNMGVCS